MRVHEADSVLEAYQQGLSLLLSDWALVEESRAGEVRVWPEPVVTVTNHPERCVLLDRKRMANPFFHLYEALWMLCGSQDSTMLDHFVSDFSERFGESDGRQHGAYGWRWRYHWSADQIKIALARLRASQTDRRVVIAMWDPMVDAFYPDAEHVPADIPCNTHIYPRIVDGALDMTVCCRSNDAVWGAHGANAVHFSFLQQYMAAQLGVGVGRMRQLSNNYHMYMATARELDPSPPAAPWEEMMPVFDPETVRGFVGQARRVVADPLCATVDDPWLSGVALPMFVAHAGWRTGEQWLTEDAIASIGCPVWRMAAELWCRR